jgi:hypothetical protein
MPSTMLELHAEGLAILDGDRAVVADDFCMASAIFSPISASPAEMVPTVGDLLLGFETSVASALIWATTASWPFWMPRRMPSASAPAVTLLQAFA